MRNTLKIILVGIILLSFITTIYPIKTCQASATTIYVDDSGGANYTTIQEAITAANTGDTIYVYSGTYNENVEITKSLTLTGQSSSNTYIIGLASNKNTIKITADNVVVSGFKIDNNAGKSSDWNCIFLQSNSGCTIDSNLVENGENGIYILSSSSNTINGNTIQNCNQKGIRLSGSDGNTIYDNIVQQNGDGIYLTFSDTNEIHENDILSNGYGLNLASSNSNTIYKNDFDDNSNGHAYDTGTNSWSKSDQGNYWDDYNKKDEDGDGKGDVPYDISGGSNQDSYPLGDFSEGAVATIVSITPNPATVGQTVSFNGHGTTDVGIISDWIWTSNIDGTLSQSEDFISSTLSQGTHTIKFKVKDNDQWSEYATSTLTINHQSDDDDDTGNQKPTATIVKPSTSATVTVNQGESVEFQGYATPSEGMITEYSWRSSEDGIIGTTSSFTKSSLSVGIHTIYFKAKDSNGWSDEVSSGLAILENSGSNPTNNAPTADAGGPYTGYEGFTIVFDGSGSTTDTTITTYEWDFGDGETGSGYKLSHTYTTSGNYTVTLTITDDSGLSHTDTTTATVTSEENTTGDTSTDENTPGFEIIIIFIAITVLLFSKKRK